MTELTELKLWANIPFQPLQELRPDGIETHEMEQTDH